MLQRLFHRAQAPATQEFEFIADQELDVLDDAAPAGTPFQRIGARGVAGLVRDLYALLTEDPGTGPIIQRLHTSHGLSAVQRHMVYMLAVALGGPNRYSGRDLAEAHQGLGITPQIYQRTCLYLLLLAGPALLGVYDTPAAAVDVAVAVQDLLGKLEPMIVTEEG